MVKSIVKAVIRKLVYARLDWMPLSEASALWWVEKMKRWPAIFAGQAYVTTSTVDFGALMKLGVVDVIERNLLLHGSWDQDIAKAMREFIQQGATVIDIGANIGYFSLLASQLVGSQGKVLCIEPSQKNLSRLCEHLWLNRCSNTTILSVAAGRHDGWADICFPTYNNAGAATLRPVSSVQAQSTLQVALDDVFESHGISPDFIKLDVEGFELEALKGMERTLLRCGPLIVCELTEQFLNELGQSSRELIAFMESLGYRCSTISTSSSVPVGTLLSATDASLPGDQLDVVFSQVNR